MNDQPTNEYYTIAVNTDYSYPLERDSHVKHGKSHPEVQQGYLTTGHVTPDGHITPYVQHGPIPPTPPEPPTSGSLFALGVRWGDLLDKTWQSIDDNYTW